MTTPIEKRNHTKFYEFHGEARHNTDECMHLKKQIKEMIKAGKLPHLIKELRQNSGKEQPKAAKKGETYGKDKALAFLMVQPWERVARIGDEEHSASAWMNFMVVRSPSSYNKIIGRPGVKKLQAVPSAAHGMLKLPVEGGVITPKSSRQKKKGQAADRNQAIQDEVGKLVEAGIMKEDEIVRDIEETFKTLREINIKLNPKKCTFGEEGMFLGYKVNTKGIKVCPDKHEEKRLSLDHRSERGVQANETANSGASHADSTNGKGGTYRLFGDNQRNDLTLPSSSNLVLASLTT
nr:reverse transcriptase domain-containing protein [Tanacetum cinerariifolium]